MFSHHSLSLVICLVGLSSHESLLWSFLTDVHITHFPTLCIYIHPVFPIFWHPLQFSEGSSCCVSCSFVDSADRTVAGVNNWSRFPCALVGFAYAGARRSVWMRGHLCVPSELPRGGDLLERPVGVGALRFPRRVLGVEKQEFPTGFRLGLT